MKNVEYSQVKKRYEPLEHRTSLLATREILRASAMLHLRGTVSGYYAYQQNSLPLSSLQLNHDTSSRDFCELRRYHA